MFQLLQRVTVLAASADAPVGARVEDDGPLRATGLSSPVLMRFDFRCMRGRVVFCGRPAYSDTAVIINTVRAGNWNPLEMGDGDEGVFDPKREYDVAFTYESPTKPKDRTIEKMGSNEIDCETFEGHAFGKCIWITEFGWNPAWPGVLLSKNDNHLTLFVTVVERDSGNVVDGVGDSTTGDDVVFKDKRITIDLSTLSHIAPTTVVTLLPEYTRRQGWGKPTFKFNAQLRDAPTQPTTTTIRTTTSTTSTTTTTTTTKIATTTTITTTSTSSSSSRTRQTTVSTDPQKKNNTNVADDDDDTEIDNGASNTNGTGGSSNSSSAVANGTVDGSNNTDGSKDPIATWIVLVIALVVLAGVLVIIYVYKNSGRQVQMPLHQVGGAVVTATANPAFQPGATSADYLEPNQMQPKLYDSANAAAAAAAAAAANAGSAGAAGANSSTVYYTAPDPNQPEAYYAGKVPGTAVYAEVDDSSVVTTPKLDSDGYAVPLENGSRASLHGDNNGSTSTSNA